MSPHFKPSLARKPEALKVVGKNHVRIIGGEWRSRVIDFPDAEGLRPTANRIRETLFNWLGQNLHDKRCLDLFAGSGALGFEAASRGAVEVVMIERNSSVMRALEASREKLGARQCSLIRQGAIEFLAVDKATFDIVFLDPPFASDLLPNILKRLEAHLGVNGVVYAEWHAPLALVISALPGHGWKVLKHGKAGAVHFALMTPVKGEI